MHFIDPSVQNDAWSSISPTSKDIQSIITELLFAQANVKDFNYCQQSTIQRCLRSLGYAITNMLIERQKSKEENQRLRPVIHELQDKVGRYKQAFTQDKIWNWVGIVAFDQKTFWRIHFGGKWAGKNGQEGATALERLYKRMTKGFVRFGQLEAIQTNAELSSVMSDNADDRNMDRLNYIVLLSDVPGVRLQ